MIQNAHDAHRDGQDGRILLRLVIGGEGEGDLYVANDGIGFDWDNVNAIRNVGLSSKTVGEGIGNKGLGFRSVETLTHDPRIYSQSRARPNQAFDGFCFRFAGPDEVLAEVSALAPPDVAREVAKTMPRYLASVPIMDQPDRIAAFARAGFATVIHVPISTEAALANAKKQVSALLGAEAPLLLFLDRLREVTVEIVEGGSVQRKVLSREVKEELRPSGKSGSDYEIVEIQPTGERYLVARRSLDREKLLAAVERSITQEPQLARWRDWRGEPKVAVAVALHRPDAGSGRVYNFLPMAAEMPSPIAGHVDAPFYASIDRRRANFELPLNAFLLDELAETAVFAAAELKPLAATKHGVRFDDACWVSGNRELAVPDGAFGDDGLGFDFRVRTKEVEWRYEVKSSLDDSYEFEFTRNEMRVAAECSADASRRYRILYVPFVDDPTRWRVMELPNPMSEAGRTFFRTVGAGATRMRFDPTA